MGLKTELINGREAFERLAGDWDGLAGAAMTSTPFQMLAYQRGWWAHLGPGEAGLHTVVVRGEDGRPRAIGCFYLLDGVVYFNGCVEETDYLDLIVGREEAEAGWTAVFDSLLDERFPAWRALNLCNVPQASPTRAILPRLAERAGLTFAEEVHEVCPVVPLSDSFDSYLDGLDKKQRHEIRRKLRRADGEEMTITAVTKPSDGLAAAVDLFLDLMARSTPEKAAWLVENDGRRALFHEVAEAAARAGTLQLLFAGVEGRQAAALFNFDYGGRIWVYNSGLDPASFGYLSPGVVLTARAIERAIGDGRSEFDFLRGDEAYKYRFGAEDTRIYRLSVERG